MVLEARAVTKTFGSVIANDAVDFSLNAGEIHALLGENGAGKSTFLRLLAGLDRPDSGTIIGLPFREIGLVHQHFQLFEGSTVAENVAAGAELRRGPFYDRRATEARVSSLAGTLGLSLDPRRRVADLPLALKQQTEILRLLWRDTRILLLDEPTAVLGPQEARGLLGHLRTLADQGRAVVLVTHKLTEVIDFADRITVLRDGRVVGTQSRGESDAEGLARLMVGRGVTVHSAEPRAPGSSLLEITAPTGWTLSVHEGEIVGIAGVAGNGQDDLEAAVIEGPSRGWILRPQTPDRLSYIPSDRQDRGSAAGALVAETALWGHEPTLAPGPWLGARKRDALVGPWVQAFGVRGPGLRGRTGHLSGGNLQKLIVARELAHRSPVLVAAEPTRGVDPGAAATIHSALLDYRRAGGAVVLISSDLSEVLRLSDRIAVLYRGRLAGLVDRAEATEEKLGRWMAGWSEDHHAR